MRTMPIHLKILEATKEPATGAHVCRYYHLGGGSREIMMNCRAAWGTKYTLCHPPKAAINEQSPPPVSHLPGSQLQSSAPSNHLYGLFLLQPRRPL